MKLSQKQIGQRITALRKTKGLSQEDLAQQIKISRPSLAQIELGNRSVNILELQNLAMVLEFSLDDFMSTNFSVNDNVESVSEKKSIESEERISIPTLKSNKFKNVLLYILKKCAGKPNVGETVLYKLLYFSDFNYYELYEEHLTGAKYRKLPYGPVPQKLDTIIKQMIESNQIERIKTPYFDKLQTRYIPLVNPDLKLINGAEKEVIDKVIEQMSDWSAAMISNYSHGDKPWKATNDNDEINYELAFYRRPPYSVRVYGEDQEDTF
jgi:transcriptional regulator with XRE-family HTH domain